jgi:hypothetical protein
MKWIIFFIFIVNLILCDDLFVSTKGTGLMCTQFSPCLLDQAFQKIMDTSKNFSVYFFEGTHNISNQYTFSFSKQLHFSTFGPGTAEISLKITQDLSEKNLISFNPISYNYTSVPTITFNKINFVGSKQTKKNFNFFVINTFVNWKITSTTFKDIKLLYNSNSINPLVSSMTISDSIFTNSRLYFYTKLNSCQNTFPITGSTVNEDDQTVFAKKIDFVQVTNSIFENNVNTGVTDPFGEQ